uniref:Uncharacterized protein n=1 Tax=Zea mays TaxID=4577 RepID=A0A804R2R5_MAIZE
MWRLVVWILMMCSLSFSVNLPGMLKLTYTGQVGHGEQVILVLLSCFMSPDISTVSAD